MLKQNNEYEITYCKESGFIDLHRYIGDINMIFGEKGKNTLYVDAPKCTNYLYVIGGSDYHKNRLTIKLDDGSLFLCMIKKERISSIKEDIQHYHEYLESDFGSKWCRMEDFDFLNCFIHEQVSYIYFSNKTKFSYRELGVSLREDTTYFIDVVNMKVAKQIQYLEFESYANSNIEEYFEVFDQKIKRDFGFSPLCLDNSKLTICKSIAECKLPNDLDNYCDFFSSIFSMIYLELLG